MTEKVDPLWLLVLDLERRIILSKIKIKHEKEFVLNLVRHGDPFNLREEQSQDQIEWLKKLHAKYCQPLGD